MMWLTLAAQAWGLSQLYTDEVGRGNPPQAPPPLPPGGEKDNSMVQAAKTAFTAIVQQAQKLGKRLDIPVIP